jgi:hypothetical protein
MKTKPPKRKRLSVAGVRIQKRRHQQRAAAARKGAVHIVDGIIDQLQALRRALNQAYDASRSGVRKGNESAWFRR